VKSENKPHFATFEDDELLYSEEVSTQQVCGHGTMNVSCRYTDTDVFIAMENTGGTDFHPVVLKNGDRLELQMHGKSGWEVDALRDALRKLLIMLDSQPEKTIAEFQEKQQRERQQFAISVAYILASGGYVESDYVE
jgi:hypothetical protein